MKALIVTWDAGGVTQPAIGLGRLLMGRGHDVTTLAPAVLGPRVAAAGGRYRAWPRSLEFDPRGDRSFEDEWPNVFRNILLGPGLPAAVATAVERSAPDVVIVDFMLRSVLFQAEALGLPAVPLIHMPYRHIGGRDEAEDPDTEWGWRWTYRELNGVRHRMGLLPLPVGPDNSTVAIAARAPAAVVVMPREFDDWPQPPPSVRHVGPIFEKASPVAWESPWRPGDPRPLIVVSLGTTFMHQGALMVRICDALAPLDARVLLLTGNAVDPADLVLPSGVEVRAFVPHLAVLPEASLLVTHAGMGSLMAAFATGVPTLCVPLGRDQATNAQRALELGTSITVGADAAAPEVAAAASRALGSPELRHNAGQMRAAVAGYDTARLAGEALEAIAGSGQSRRARRLLVPAG